MVASTCTLSSLGSRYKENHCSRLAWAKKLWRISQQITWVWWLTPVTLAMQKAEVGGFESDGDCKQKCKTRSEKITESKKDWGCGSSGRAPA
jgi:hypothetical protein